MTHAPELCRGVRE